MIPNTIKARGALAITLVSVVIPLKAHEYWLDPIDSSIGLGESAIVDIRNGQHFSGAAFPYDNSLYESISITSANGRKQYNGRLGDYPAIHPELNIIGIHSITVDTTPKVLTYDSWIKFTDFLKYHGFEDLAQQHLIRDLPKQNIKESYTRSAKTLVQVNGVGSTRAVKSGAPSSETQTALTPTGSIFELVLLGDPYRTEKNISAELLYEGSPLVGRQVEMFWNGTQSIRLTAVTDKKGVATFKLLGDGDYMLNAVHIVEPQSSDVHWQSYWASFTFER